MRVLKIATLWLVRLVVLGFALYGAFSAIRDLWRARRHAEAERAYAAMWASGFPCPDGMEVKIEFIPETNRYARWYVPLQDGPFEQWQSGRKRLEGQFKRGKRDGKWVYYSHSDGTIETVVVYRDGREIEETDGKVQAR